MRANDGGPAFPQPILDTKGKSGIVASEELDFGGMTLRDYFAAKWMQGFVANSSVQDVATEDASRYAYKIADAMLKARES